jgi:hypothetical protein
VGEQFRKFLEEMEISEFIDAVDGYCESDVPLSSNFTLLPPFLIAMIEDPQTFIVAALEHEAQKKGGTECPNGGNPEEALATRWKNLTAEVDYGSLSSKLLGVETAGRESVKAFFYEETSPGKWTPKKKFSAIIDEVGLRTLCDPSGTTLDLLATLLMINPGKLVGTLDSLLRYQADPDSALSDDFKELFTSLSFHMQLRQYHSCGEILASFLAFALYYRCNNAAVTRDDLLKLLLNFRENPAKFFPTPKDFPPQNLTAVFNRVRGTVRKMVPIHGGG